MCDIRLKTLKLSGEDFIIRTGINSTKKKRSHILQVPIVKKRVKNEFLVLLTVFNLLVKNDQQKLCLFTTGYKSNDDGIEGTLCEIDKYWSQCVVKKTANQRIICFHA
jgi:hypothetical protein